MGKTDQMESDTLLKRPSRTAFTTAFMRALLTRELDPDIKGTDYLAKIFLDKSYLDRIPGPDKLKWARENSNRGAYEYMAARTNLIDQLFVACLKKNIPQIVFLGAGFDTRAWRFENVIKNTQIYELDLPATQKWKRKCLSDAGIEAKNYVHFVPTSFNLKSLRFDLAESSYDPKRETFFVWEGVTHYLSENVVDETFRFIKENSATRSQVIFDYIYRSVLRGDIEVEGVGAVLDWASKSGEPFKFGIEKGEIESFLKFRGLKLIKSYAPADLENEFLRMSTGELYGSTTGFFSFAHAQT